MLRDANPKDAPFILSLRTDENKSRFLSPTSPELEQQIRWLEDYANRNDQIYFIIENKQGESLGTVRLYDQQGDSFCWGSWILKDEAPSNAAIESVLMVYAYAINHLGFQRSHFDVRKGNESVWRFHERFGATKTGETEDDYLFGIDKEQITRAMKRYRKFLPGLLGVEK